MKRCIALLLSGCAAALALAVTSTAAAQNKLDSDATWRRANSRSTSSFYRFTFEARFGAYYPRIDEEPGLAGKTPYADYFGTGAQFYFGMELDWTPIRIPYIGKLGPGFGWGFTPMNAKAKDPGSGDATDTVTSITIHAMHTSAVLRIDEIAKRTVIPIVPYAKLGFGFGTWSSGTTTGTSKIGGDCDATKPTDCTVAEGLSFGPHIALGGMFGLNWLDPRSSAMAREGTGIKQAYIFGEWMYADLTHSTKAPMYIGTSTWVLGLAVDF